MIPATLEKTTAKPDGAKDAITEFTVGSTPIYIGTERYEPGASVKLTASQAKRLDALVIAAKPA